MKNRFLILLSFVLIVGRDAVCANTSMVRERININRDWRYQIDDPDGVGAALHYSRLKPYLLSCANDFIIFVSRHHPAITPVFYDTSVSPNKVTFQSNRYSQY